MRDIGPWDRVPPSVPQIRAMALRNLHLRTLMLAAFLMMTVGACLLGHWLALAPLNLLLLSVSVLFLAVPFARAYLPMVRQWRDLGDGHRDLGLTRLHYSALVVDTLILIVPAIGAGYLLARACGAVS